MMSFFFSGVKYNFVSCMAIYITNFKTCYIYLFLNTLSYSSFGISFHFKTDFVLNL